MSTNQGSTTVAPGSFRPATYWEDPGPLAAILCNVKGTNRRRMITDYWNAGMIDQLDPAHLADTPDPDLRRFLESLHPTFMGGEYLPGFMPGEVEIARIELQSTTADVISIRARRRPGGKRIYYRVVDEYGTEFRIRPKSSARPLTFAQLIRLIDTADNGEYGGLALFYNQGNLEGGSDPESLRHFTTVSSPFYPGLFDHYDAVHEHWVEENLPAEEDSGEEPTDAGL